MSNQPQNDDALFEALGKSKKKKRRSLVRTILIIVLVIALVLVMLVSTMQRRVREQFMDRSDDILSARVEVGTISTLVSGSGVLLNVDTESLTVPEGVEVTEILVDFGDTVEEGTLLALVDTATVRTAMADVQTRIDELDDQIRDAESDRVSSSVTAGVSGRVKAIYAGPGDSVADVMVEHGALALISLDGNMALSLETEQLRAGDTVSVTREDGTVLAGTVKSAAGGKATILITDNGPRMDEKVSVYTADGTLLGTAALTIHNPLAVTGYAGTVQTVTVKENAKVTAYTRLFTLTDTAHSANYDALLRQREELEKTLLELLKLQKYGGLTATVSGSVLSVADLDSTEPLTEIVLLSPDVQMSVTIGVDESDILALKLGQEADVTVSSASEEVLTGIITELDKTASDGAYTAVITLDKLPGMLQGMTAEVDVKIYGVENALLIPVDALNQSGAGDYVFTAYDEELQQYGGRVDVTIGLSNDSYVEITSGLNPGDTVYYTKSTSMYDIFQGMSGMSGMGGNRGGQMPGGQMPGGQMPGGQVPGSRR